MQTAIYKAGTKSGQASLARKRNGCVCALDYEVLCMHVQKLAGTEPGLHYLNCGTQFVNATGDGIYKVQCLSEPHVPCLQKRLLHPMRHCTVTQMFT